MKNKNYIVSVVLSLLLVSAPSFAHHNFRAVFDIDQPVIITGTVARMVFSNPHARLYVNAIDEETGEAVVWDFELEAASMLQRRGWKRDTFLVGDTVTVHAARARNNPYMGNIEFLTKINEDGSEGFTSGSARE